MKIDFSSVKQKSILALLIMLVMISVIVTLVFSSPNGVAYADNNAVELTEQCRKYTDTISPNGIDFNQYRDESISQISSDSAIISNLVPAKLSQGKLHGTFVAFLGSEYRIKAQIEKDDNIIKLIPKALFTYVNKTIFVGKAYGFAIITEQLTDTVLKSTVILLNVTGSVSDYLADIKVEVACTLDFVYINQTAAISLPAVSTGTTENVLCTFSLLNGITSAVVPLPKIQTETLAAGRTTKMMYVESKDYMLGNISFAGQIRNQNDYNIGDAQYDVNNDYG